MGVVDGVIELHHQLEPLCAIYGAGEGVGVAAVVLLRRVRRVIVVARGERDPLRDVLLHANPLAALVEIDDVAGDEGGEGGKPEGRLDAAVHVAAEVELRQNARGANRLQEGVVKAGLDVPPPCAETA